MNRQTRSNRDWDIPRGRDRWKKCNGDDECEMMQKVADARWSKPNAQARAAITQHKFEADHIVRQERRITKGRYASLDVSLRANPNQRTRSMQVGPEPNVKLARDDRVRGARAGPAVRVQAPRPMRTAAARAPAPPPVMVQAPAPVAPIVAAARADAREVEQVRRPFVLDEGERQRRLAKAKNLRIIRERQAAARKTAQKVQRRQNVAKAFIAKAKATRTEQEQADNNMADGFFGDLFPTQFDLDMPRL